MELLKQRIDSIEIRVDRLENSHENDKEELHRLDTSIQVFINEMKNISDELKNVVSNFKEISNKNNAIYEKEILSLKQKNEKLEQRIEVLDNKIEQETIIANSEKWKKITSHIITSFLSAIVGLVLATIGLGGN